MVGFRARWLASVDSLRLVDRVADHVVRAIQTGEFLPGSELSPQELAERFRTSTDMIEPALARQIASGWLIRHRNAIVVRPIVPAELRQAYEIRGQFEPQLAISSMRLWSAGHVEKFRQAAAIRDDSLAPMSARTEANLQLRQLIAVAPHMEWQTRVLGEAWHVHDRVTEVSARVRPTQSGAPWPRLGTHVLDIYERDSFAAIRHWWKGYLEQGWQLVEQTLDDLAC